MSTSIKPFIPHGTAYVDGDYVPLCEARLPLMDWGFLHGDVTYDVIHVWKNRFFRLDAHFDRFFRNVELLRLDANVDWDGLATILAECVHRSHLEDAYVEVICTRGMPSKPSRDPREAVNRLYAFAMPFGWIANEEQRERGLRLRIAQTVTRISPSAVDPTVKNFHWLDMIMGLYEAYDHDDENVLLCDESGNLTEGPGFNVFALIDGRMKTPGSGVLEGITRKSTIELCEMIQLPIDVTTVSAEQIRTADEVFITSTAGGIAPVTVIDGSPVADGKVGEMTQRLNELYWEKHDDPAWSTAVVDLLPKPELASA